MKLILATLLSFIHGGVGYIYSLVKRQGIINLCQTHTESRNYDGTFTGFFLGLQDSSVSRDSCGCLLAFFKGRAVKESYKLVAADPAYGIATSHGSAD